MHFCMQFLLYKRLYNLSFRLQLRRWWLTLPHWLAQNSARVAQFICNNHLNIVKGNIRWRYFRKRHWRFQTVFGTEMANSDYFLPNLFSVIHFIRIKKETLQGLKVLVFNHSFNYILINDLLFSGGNISTSVTVTRGKVIY